MKNNIEELSVLYKKKGDLLKEIVALGAALNKTREQLTMLNIEISRLEK